jgi:hypothetical protein
VKPTLNPLALVSLKEDKVTRMLSRLGLSYRISRRDGVSSILTPDVRPERYTLMIENNVVTEARFG